MARTRTLVMMAILAIATLTAATTAAHEHREVGDGQYEVTVGFLDEPAFVGGKNGLSLRIVTVDGEEPVEGLESTLQAEVIYGDQSMELELQPAFGDPGHYTSVFFPMAPGAYTFHISGEIEGTSIDEEFTSGPETFSEVEPVEPLQFPKLAD